MQKIIPIADGSLLTEIFGIQDKKIDILEQTFGVVVDIHSGGLVVKGSTQKVDKAVYFIKDILSLSREGINLTSDELMNRLISPKLKIADTKDLVKIKVSSKKKLITPNTLGQESYVKAIKSYDITFAVGPAGTGKTYLAMAMAISSLLEGKTRRIILTRPAIEAGESLGYLPGDMSQKLAPYLRPLYDALYDMMDGDMIEEYIETGIIEIAPLAYMRGRTLNNAFIILDEAQNCTTDQLKMFLTRLGFNSKTVITGDITQSDLPQGKPVGLIKALKILNPIKGIKFINLSNEDVVRHPLIQEIIKAYESFS